MRQQTLAGSTFEHRSRTTRRERFLQEMEWVVPWERPVDVVGLCYTSGERRRSAVALDRMLSVYSRPHWYNFSDLVLEEALYEPEVTRRFLGTDPKREVAPDEITTCKSYPLLERHELGVIFAQINANPADHDVQVSSRTIDDSTIIGAPSSIKNELGQRTPRCISRSRASLGEFGLEGRFGGESAIAFLPPALAKPRNTADSTALGELIHGDETPAWCNMVNNGQHETVANEASFPQSHIYGKGHRHTQPPAEREAANRYKSSGRSKAEHTTGPIRRPFDFRKDRYRGITKNFDRLPVPSVLANLFMMRSRLALDDGY